MKKIFALTLTLIAVISLSGCSGQNKSSSDTPSFRKNFLQVKNFQLKITGSLSTGIGGEF